MIIKFVLRVYRTCQHGCCCDPDSNRGPPEYKTEALPFHSACPVSSKEIEKRKNVGRVSFQTEVPTQDFPHKKIRLDNDYMSALSSDCVSNGVKLKTDGRRLPYEMINSLLIIATCQNGCIVAASCLSGTLHCPIRNRIFF